MGGIDRTVRILLGAVFVYLYFAGIVTGTWGLVLVILGGIFVFTSVVGFCPMYAAVGINTCATKKFKAFKLFMKKRDHFS